MQKFFYSTFIAIVTLIGVNYQVWAQETTTGVQFKPPPGYAGETIIAEFDQLKVIPVLCKNSPCKHPKIKDQELILEGKISKTSYSASGKEVSDVAVVRNYETAIKSISGQRVNDPESLVGPHVFLVSKEGVNTWIVLDKNFGGVYELTLVQEEKMVQSVTASQLADSIKADGYATLHINFDTNKSILKEDGQAAVKEIVALLKADSQLKLSVEGHTDDAGDAKSNKTLSEQRAKAVMQAAVAQGVNASRLSSAGFGAEKPVADNRNEEGRAKNRRVELVKK
jgi:OmpA-OmpF porin, OOP family